MKRRVLAWILVMGLLLTLVPAFAETVEGTQAVTAIEALTVEEPSAEADEPEAEEAETPETEAPEVEEKTEAPAAEEPEVEEDDDEADINKEETAETEAPEAEEPETDVTEEPEADEPDAELPETPAIPVPEEPVEDNVVEEPQTGDPVPPMLPDGILVLPVPFFADVTIELKNEGDLFYGDEITLKAVVEANSDDEYTVKWAYYNEEFDPEDEESQEWIGCGDGEALTFTVTKANAERVYRATVNGKFTSESFTLPAVSERPVTDEPEVEEPDVEEPETDDPEIDEPETEEPETEEPETEEPDVTEGEEETEVGSDEEAETPDEEAEEPGVYPYEYVRDEEGNLVLDENGNPIAIVPEGVDIPVEFLRDEEGNLVLDENGNPIPTQFIPQTAHKVVTLEDQLDPNRSIDIYADWGEGELDFGMESTLIAVLRGYGNAVYTVQWQVSEDGEEWADIEDATDVRYTMVVTEDNYLDYWRVVVTITDVVENESVPGDAE